MEDNLNFVANEDDLNIFPKGRRPKLFGPMEDNLNH